MNAAFARELEMEGYGNSAQCHLSSVARKTGYYVYREWSGYHKITKWRLQQCFLVGRIHSELIPFNRRF